MMFKIFTQKPNRWISAEKRFWFYVDAYLDKDKCWLWFGSRAGGDCEKRRYGQFQVDGKKVYAHRFSWELHNKKPIPDGDHVCHSCDQPLCVNPYHLFLTTQSGNMQDCVNKGRHASLKINPNDRIVIGNSNMPTKWLAEKHGVHRTTIQKIRRKARAALKVLNTDASFQDGFMTKEQAE